MNALLLVIDSLDYTRCQRSKIDLLPYINKRAKNNTSCSNIYSQAPYTEAAVMSLYCGQNTLDNHGYMERFNNVEKTLFEVVKESGYEVFYNSFQPQGFPSSLRRGVDYIMYDRGFDNIALWDYRVKYYKQKYDNNVINDNDYNQLIRILDDNFKEWEFFLLNLSRNDNSIQMIKNRNVDFDINKVLSLVKKQIELYNDDKIGYIIDILKKGDKHLFFNIPFFYQKDFESSPELTNIFEDDLKKVTKTIRRKNLFGNFLYNKDLFFSIIKTTKSFIFRDKEDFDNRKLIIYNMLYCGRGKFGTDAKSLKAQPSFFSHICSFLNWLDNRNNSNPFFACIHVDDIHYPEMYFTYDSNNEKLLNSEVKDINHYLNKKTINRKGFLSEDLALRYVDKKCEFLFRQLEKRGVLDDTCVFITADHGFSYSGYPIRNKLVNTFYLENYKIPFYVFGKNIKKYTVNALKSSLDIPATICDVLNIEKPNCFVGNSVYEEDNNKINTIEFCGGGCPDLNEKPIMLAAYDDKYMVASVFKVYEGFSTDKITEVYDLVNDPNQRHNIRKKMDNYDLKKYLDVIKNRTKKIVESDVFFDV